MYLNEKVFLSLSDSAHLQDSAQKSKDPTRFLVGGLFTYLDLLEEHLGNNFNYADFSKIIFGLADLLDMLQDQSKESGKITHQSLQESKLNPYIQTRLNSVMDEVRPFFLHLPLPTFQMSLTQSTLVTCRYTQTYLPTDVHPKLFNLDQFIFTNYWVWFPFYWLLSQYYFLCPKNSLNYGLAPYIIQALCEISSELQEPLLLSSQVYQYHIYPTHLKKIK